MSSTMTDMKTKLRSSKTQSSGTQETQSSSTQETPTLPTGNAATMTSPKADVVDHILGNYVRPNISPSHVNTGTLCAALSYGENNEEMPPGPNPPVKSLNKHPADDQPEKTNGGPHDGIMRYLKSLDDTMKHMGSKINEEMKSMNLKLTEMQKDITAIQNVVPRVTVLEKKVHDTRAELDAYKSEVHELKHKYDVLLERHLNLDTYNRRENLLFHGVKHDPKENCHEKIRSILKTNLAIPHAVAENMKFQRCHRLGKSPNSPIICRFAFSEDRDLVWSKKASLRETKIFLAENFPMEIEERRRKLVPIMQAAKAKKMVAYIKYDKLIIDGNQYSVDTLNSLPPSFSSALVATETKNDITCFYTSASPLSNFHCIKEGFLVDNQKFDCVERCYQMNKALCAEEPSVAQKILDAKSARECKALGESIKIDENEWFPKAKEVMLRACRAKFEQHLPSRRFLLNTGQTTLAEAGPDVMWGIGLKMHNPDAFIKGKWLGRNVLGEVLERIRYGLKATENLP